MDLILDLEISTHCAAAYVLYDLARLLQWPVGGPVLAGDCYSTSGGVGALSRGA
jgi:hypothetical protein